MQVSQKFSHSLDALLMLRFAVFGKFPNFATDRQLSHTPGWLAVVTALAGVSPELRTLGILNQCQWRARTHTNTHKHARARAPPTRTVPNDPLDSNFCV